MSGSMVEGFRLSPRQHHLWRLAAPKAPAPYRLVAAVRISGSLSPGQLRAGIDRLLAEQEILRTVFPQPAELNVPLQAIAESPAAIAPAWHDAGSQGTDQQQALISARLAALQEIPFDFEQGPLLHVEVVQLSGVESMLLLCLPAALADRTSLRLLVDFLLQAAGTSTSHAGLSPGSPAGDAAIQEEPPLQFADISQWQNEMLASGEAAAGREFWQQLDYAEAEHLRMPLEHDAASDSFSPCSYIFELPRQAVEKIGTVAAAAGATDDDVLLAAWCALLYRLTGQTEFTLAVESDGRAYEELETLLGPLAVHLPTHFCLHGRQSLTNLLAHILATRKASESWLDSFSSEQFFAHHADRDGYLPVAFGGCAPLLPLAAGGINARFESVCDITERFRLRLSFLRQGEQLRAQLQYDAQRFERPAMERLAQQYGTLLAAALESDSWTVARSPLLDGAGLHEVLSDFNPALHDTPPAVSIVERFEQQAALHPRRIAVTGEAGSLTYAQLNTQANRLAKYLIALGLRPEGRVGCCMERSTDLVVTLLAILKAGGAYLPLDPQYPRDRLAFMLEDGGVELLLTETKFAALFPQGNCRVVCSAQWKTEITRLGGENLPRLAGPDSLAYVTYTSGSTGVPKGVEVLHRGVVRLVCDNDYARLDAEQVLLHLSSISFDASTFELWGPLLHGGKCVLLGTAGQVPTLDELETAVREHEVTTLWLTSSLFNMVIDQRASVLAGVKQLLVGGEALSADHVRRAQRMLPGTQLINGYGPTESTTFTCCYHLPPTFPEDATAVPIGRPIRNTQVYLLDEELMPVPPGAVGKLYIGGAGLARGYLDRAGLTAEEFVPHPFPERPGERLYCSGDLARYDEQGTIHFLGRTDDQVKIRGFRIELGEIEAALRAHPSVQNAVAMVWSNDGGERRLCGYYMSRAGEAIAAPALQHDLSERLPAYMVPAMLFPVDEFPLTGNGKVDRERLPSPEDMLAVQQRPFTPPRDELESHLAGMWSEILSREEIGVHDDFFQVGGDSIKAAVLVNQIQARLAEYISVIAMFEASTISQCADYLRTHHATGVARWLDQGEEKSDKSPQQPAEPGDVKLHTSGQEERGEEQGEEQDALGTSWPVSAAQRYVWFVHQAGQGHLRYNIPAMLRLHGPLNVAAFEEAITEIIRRHSALRTVFRVVAGELWQEILPEGKPPLAVVDLQILAADAREDEVRRRALVQGQREFDLADGPLYRFELLRLGAADHVFLFTFHHTICDGWSLGVFTQELSALYALHCGETASPLPAVPLQLKEHVVCQQRQLAGAKLAELTSFWRARLADAPAQLHLPTDRPRPDVFAHRGARLPFDFPPELSAAVRQFSRREGVTSYITLLSAFSVFLSKYSGETDIVVGTPLAGRPDARSAQAIGFFANFLVQRNTVSGTATFRELLANVRERSLQAYGHRELPFELLTESIRPPRDAGRTPIFQVLFAYQQKAMESERAAGLEFVPESRDNGMCMFDLTLSLVERTEGGMSAGAIYSTDLFDATTVARMMGHFITLVQTALAQPDCTIDALCMISDQEARSIRQPVALGAQELSAVPELSAHSQAVPDTAFAGRNGSAGLRLLVCDESGRPVPLGLVGTAYVLQAQPVEASRTKATEGGRRRIAVIDGQTFAHTTVGARRLPGDRIEIVPRPILDSGPRPRPPLEKRPSRPAAGPIAAESAAGTLLQIWRELLQRDDIRPRDNFFDIGGTESTALKLATEVEQRLLRTLPLRGFLQEPTLQRAAEMLGLPENSNAVEAVVTFRGQGTKPPLFFLPLVDGYAFYCRSLIEHFDKDQPVYCLQPLALDGQQHVYTTIEEMATAYLSEVRRIQPHGPYYLCGYCFAGIPAYELARQLTEQGEQVALLALVDAKAPAARRMLPFYRRLIGHLRKIGRLAPGSRWPYLRHRLQGISRLLGRPLACLKPAGETSSADAVETSNIVRIRAASMAALEAYEPRPYPGKVTIFPTDQSERRDFYVQVPLDGWGELAQGGVEVHSLPCRHLEVLREPHVQVLASKLCECLGRSQWQTEDAAAPALR